MSSKPAATYLSKSRQVAQELLARIADADVDPGDTFATEAELLQQFNVSRPTLREGIRILESQGVLEQRPGPGPGRAAARKGVSRARRARRAAARERDHDPPLDRSRRRVAP